MAGKWHSFMAKPILALFLVPWIAGLLLGDPGRALAASHSPSWPLWDHFRKHFLQSDGRVIDRTDRDRSTSEGEAYTLYFSLVSGDRQTFRKVLEWTRNNLAGGDLDHHLPAWIWGKRPNGDWGILDVNPASDADCWIAYALIEAGRIWKIPAYGRQGRHLLSMIEKNETAFLPGYGWALLPGPWGFRNRDGTGRLNPSYLPPEILLDFEAVSPRSPWTQILETTLSHMGSIAPHGFVPDWIAVTKDGQVRPDPVTGPLGSYDAIRVYLWASLLPSRSPLRKKLLSHMSGMLRYLDHHLRPPLYANTLTGWTAGKGPPGFSAAILPLLRARGDKRHIKSLLKSIKRMRHQGLYGTPPPYYDQVLALFGTGFLEGRYGFGAKGHLLLPARPRP